MIQNSNFQGQGAPSTQPKKKSKAPIIILVLSLIAMLGLGIGGYVYFLDKQLGGDLLAGTKKQAQNKNGNDADSNSGNSSVATAANGLIDITDYSSGETSSDGEIVSDGPEESTLTDLSVAFNESGDFLYLYGDFSTPISSSDEVLNFIKDHADQTNISDPHNTLRFISEDAFNDYKSYKFQQVLNDISVFGNELVITVNSDGEIDSIEGCYSPIDISTTASKTSEEALETVKKYVDEDTLINDNGLTILPHSKNGTPKLAYDYSIFSPTIAVEIFVDANTCEILDEISLKSEALQTVDVSTNGSRYRVDLEEIEFNTYFIADNERNIMVSDAERTSETVATMTNGFIGGMEPFVAFKVGTEDDGSIKLIVQSIGLDDIINPAERIIDLADPLRSQLTEYAIGSLSSVQKAYDYYNIMYGWKSFDGKGLPLKLLVSPNSAVSYEIFLNKDMESLDDKIWYSFLGLYPSLKDYNGAGYIKTSNAILIGKIMDKPLVGTGILSHEYTHGVFFNRVFNNNLSMSTNPTMECINEAYADIMGSVISGDWEFMAHEIPSDWEYYNTLVRSAIDPNRFSGPAIMDFSDPYYDPDSDDEHHNATILSHTAYLMTQKGLSDDRVAEVFFGSMGFLPTHSDFETVARTVIRTADAASYTLQDQAIITSAFYETKILDSKDALVIKVHCGNHPIPNATIRFKGTEIGKTDSAGNLRLDFDPDWMFGYGDISVEADGYNNLTESTKFRGFPKSLDFNLAVNRSFAKVNGSDPEKRGERPADSVIVTILEMQLGENSSLAKEVPQEYYVRKGFKLDLNLLVNSLNIPYISTDGARIYIGTEDVPVELAYYIYGTDDVFDFSQPIYEDVILEPKFTINGVILSSPDINNFIRDLESELLNREYNGNSLEDAAKELDNLFNGDGLKEYADKFYDFWED